MPFNTKEILDFWKSNVHRIHAGHRVKSIPRILAERKEQFPEQKEQHSTQRDKLVNGVIRRRAQAV